MTVDTLELTGESVIQRYRWLIADTVAMAGRYVRHTFRVPQLLVFATVQPVIFVLLFAFVFGGAIAVPSGSYIDFLLPGIFVQSMVFGALQTGVGLAEDMQAGMFDRFRSLPMARSALLAGRGLADLVRNVFLVAVMTGVGYLIGFRFHGTLSDTVLLLALVLAFSFAMSWVMATIGLLVKDPEAAQAAAFPFVAPFVFASSIFVPVASMPDWLRFFAEHQPVSVVADAVRGLSLGTPDAGAIFGAVLWISAILAVAAPLAVRVYRRRV